MTIEEKARTREHAAAATNHDRTLPNGITGLGRWVCLAAAVCAAMALAGMMLLMLGDVAGRYWFNSPIPGAGELIELAMAITVFAALPLVTMRNAHIQLDYLSKAVHGRVRAGIDALISVVSTGAMGLIAWRLAVKAMTVLSYGDSTPYLRVPIAPVAVFIAACAAGAALVFLLHSVQLLGRTVFGKSAPHTQGNCES